MPPPCSSGNPCPARFGALVVFVLCVLPAAAQRPGAAQYAAPPVISDVSVSPSGGHAALVWRLPGQPAVAAVIDLDKPAEVKVVGGFPRDDVAHVRWINDQRLQFFSVVADTGAEINKEGDAGLFAVDRDGSQLRQLIDWRWRNDETSSRIRSRILNVEWSVYSQVDDGSPDLIVVKRPRDSRNDRLPPTLARLNTLDGRLKILNTGAPPLADGWVLDAAGEPRVVTVEHNGRTQVHWRPPGGDEWTMIGEGPSVSGAELRPLALEADGTLVVAATRGADTSALYTYHPEKRAFDAEPLVALKGFDVGDDLVFDSRSRRVVGVHTLADRPFTVWFDERLAQIQQTVDKSLPAGRNNRLLCGHCESATRFVVRSWSDTHPGEYYLYDHAARKLQRLGEARPDIAESSQGRRSFHRVEARDGLSLPVLVTHPSGAAVTQPLPAVVLVHGGPWVRGSDLSWDQEAQFLASRGWRVLQVEYRGSTGFGWKHFRAGWRQWGLAMQDDLADAVAWAARERLVDPSRVCIVGASYGGYAALMGPARHPDVYRCAVSLVGVTDLELMFSSIWSDVSAQARRHGYGELIGDPVRDAEALRQASPVHRVRDIEVPVLLMQGALDRRVPKEHADAFERAARTAGVAVERVDYGDEGHGFNRTANRLDYLRRLESFLARSLDTPR